MTNEPEWNKVTGKVIQGHQIASGNASNSPFPAGSIELQKPHFEKLGLDLSPFYLGTLNISIAPFKYSLTENVQTFRQVAWSDKCSPEDFSFSECQIEFGDKIYSGMIYRPHPETKPDHFQEPSTVEILAPKIDGIDYGDSVTLHLNPEQVTLVE